MSYELMNSAIDQSRQSVELGGFPVGAVLELDGKVIATGISNGKNLNDPTSHAEIAVIRQASSIIGERALGESAVLYSSMEPCLMCYGASVWSSVARIVYAVSRGSLPDVHFEGVHDLKEINKATHSPIELIYASEYEDLALEVINQWGAQQKRQV